MRQTYEQLDDYGTRLATMSDGQLLAEIRSTPAGRWPLGDAATLVAVELELLFKMRKPPR